jgi:hypothetical protein
MTKHRDVRAIQTALRRAIANGAARIGPFLVTIDPYATGPFRNFAVPDDDAAPTPADLAALVGYFASVDWLPRLEFAARQPALEQTLAEAGSSSAIGSPCWHCLPRRRYATSRSATASRSPSPRRTSSWLPWPPCRTRHTASQG